MKKIIISLLGCRMDSGNMGVSALAASLAGLFSFANGNVEINLLIGNKNSKPQAVIVGDKQIPLHVVNYRLSPRSPFQQHLFGILIMASLYRFVPLAFVRTRIAAGNAWIKTILASDLIGDIQGGDSFSDIYGQRRFFIMCLPLLIILMLKKRYILLPQTYGPYRHALTRLLARFIIAKAARVFSRDKEGFTYLQALLKKKYRAIAPVFCPDVAFTLEPRFITPPLIHPPVPPEPEFLIGLNINGLMYNGGYTRRNMFALSLDYRIFIYELIRHLLDTCEKARLLLIPHNFGQDDDPNSDPSACRQVLARLEETAGRLPSRVHLLTSEHGPHELKKLIGTCHFFIGSRMHSCIAALSQGIPAIGVAYSYKFIGVFNSIGLGYAVIDARTTDLPSALAKVDAVLRAPAAERATQKHNIERAKEQVYAVFRSLLEEA